MMTTLFFNHTGPLMQWDHELRLLRIADLNPERETKWRLTRRELFGLGLKALWASIAA